MVTSRAVEALRERFGKYHVLEKIAQGGMAEVYKVKTVGIAGFEKVQALKRILPHSAREGRFIRSFIDEARIAVELTHRNIVQVFDFGKADGELFMAMELIEGRDLRTAMTEAVACGALCPIPVAAYVIGEVAAGLDYAHRKTDGYGGPLHIVHCDVSPSNVMLSVDGYVKILDFGVARASFASALERRRLRGKPRYMAPEQTFGEPPTAQADVFALGIIAWELMTGLPLYRGHDIKAILEAVRHTEAPRIDRLNPDVPPEIVEAVATALSHSPGARGTAADLAAACSRTALAGGARQLAAWLRALDEADVRDVGAGLLREPTESVIDDALPPPALAPTAAPAPSPPPRPSTLPTPVPGALRAAIAGTRSIELPLPDRTATVSVVIEPAARFLDPPTVVTPQPWLPVITEVVTEVAAAPAPAITDVMAAIDVLDDAAHATNAVEASLDASVERARTELRAGSYERAMASIDGALELCRHAGDHAREGIALGVAGAILLEVGLYEPAATHFANALDLLARTGSDVHRTEWLIHAGTCAIARGAGDGGHVGLAMLDEAVAEARRLTARHLEASALVARAGVQLWRGDVTAAIRDAAEGTAVAAATRLVGDEIQALARHALALVRDPGQARLDAACALADRALALLDHEHSLDGSEEEVYATCFEVRRVLGLYDQAATVKARGRGEIERKLAALANPVWRAAYLARPASRLLLA